jgi:hypothetical protein
MTEVTMQLAEALTSIKTDKKKWETDKNFVMANVVRDDRLKDSLEAQGGTKTVLQRTLQSMEDHETQIVAKLYAIQGANREVKLTIGSKTKSVGEWIIWRREVAPMREKRFNELLSRIEQSKQMVNNPRYVAAAPGQDLKVLVEIDEKKLLDTMKEHQDIMGAIDSKLSVLNATTGIVVRF